MLEGAVEGLTEELSQLLQSFGRAGNIDSDTCSNILSGLVSKTLHTDKQGAAAHTRHSTASTRSSFDQATRNVASTRSSFDQGTRNVASTRSSFDQGTRNVASTRSSFDHSATRNSADVSLYGYAASRDAAFQFQRICSESSRRSVKDRLSKVSVVLGQEEQKEAFVDRTKGTLEHAVKGSPQNQDDAVKSSPQNQDEVLRNDDSKTSFVQRLREELSILETTLHDWEDAEALMKGLGGEIMQLQMSVSRKRET